MKIQIKATRNDIYTTWRNESHTMIACDGDVNKLFHGLGKATECIFEVTTRRPRTPDYHRFECFIPPYNGGMMSYKTTIETRGFFHLTQPTSKRMAELMNRAAVIYIAVYTEEK